MLGNISGALVRFIVWLLAGKLFVSKCRVTVTYIRGGFSSTVLKGDDGTRLGPGFFSSWGRHLLPSHLRSCANTAFDNDVSSSPSSTSEKSD